MTLISDCETAVCAELHHLLIYFYIRVLQLVLTKKILCERNL